MVTISFDGEPIAAEDGEPIAAALVRAGKLALARSSKFHRPRGPYCMRGACDGCLARVDDVPNVMTCGAPAREGTVVSSQNALGSREVDLLRMTDWFFPTGMDHHELFAGVPGVQTVMQAFARRVAGLGRLPKAALGPRSAARREVDVLVVGAGPAGMAVALRASQAGRAVEVIDDQLAAGGGLFALGASDAKAWADIARPFAERASGGAIRLRSRTVAGAIFGDDVLVASEEGAEIVTARAVVLATGAYDGMLAFEGNDLPGVISARAAGALLARGALVAPRVVVAIPPGGGAFGEAFARHVEDRGARCEVTLVRGEPVRVHGSSRVTKVELREPGGATKRLAAGALLVDAAPSPAYELCVQAGAALSHAARGYLVKTAAGKIRDGFFACGEVTGTRFEPGAIDDDAARVALRLPG